MNQDQPDRYVVVCNDEEQYAIYPAERELPAGWWPAGFEGDEQACVNWVDQHWTDLRPRSLRQQLGVV